MDQLPKLWTEKFGIILIDSNSTTSECTLGFINETTEEAKYALSLQLPYKIHWKNISDSNFPKAPFLKSDILKEKRNSSNDIINYVDQILSNAVKHHASDVHFEPTKDFLKIRLRIDGSFFEEKIDKSLIPSITARIKFLSGIDLIAKKTPQDGRIHKKIENQTIDFRVSTIPTYHGDSIVLRVLDKKRFSTASTDLIPKKIRSQLLDVANSSYGLLLVTGPTGSGKTTTLYSILSEISSPHIKISTIEDPIEYEIDGAIQTEVDPFNSFSFPKILRSILRHDPDKIMIGEIRDPETAEIAVQSALTGHLVMSTLHTNDACSSIVRLMDLGVEPYKIATSLKAILSQRLLNILCSSCKTPYDISKIETQLKGIPVSGKLFDQSPSGCVSCGHSGFSSRKAIFEFFKIDEIIASLISKQCSQEELISQFSKQNSKKLIDSAKDFLKTGLISPLEFIKLIES